MILLLTTLACANTAGAQSTGAINRALPAAPARSATPAAASKVAPTQPVAVNAAAPNGERPASALDPRLTGDGERIAFQVRLGRVVPASAFTLADPYRVVVDLPEVVFAAGVGGASPAPLVTSWRAGLFMTGRSRIVFDTAGPTRVTRLAVTALADGSARLDLTVEKVTRAAFRPGEQVGAAGQAAALSAAIRPSLIPSVPEATAALARGGLQKGDRQQLRGALPAGADRRVIVLDPGHGGIDPGTHSPASGLQEKAVVLAFALQLRQKLEATGRYTVHLTRTDDTFIPLAERVRIARKLHADVFVSIHADAEYDHTVRGSTVYTAAEKGSDDQSEALAAKENASDAVAGVVPEANVDEVTDILLDLTRRETLLLNQSLAGAIANGLGQVGKLVGGAGHRAAGFRVLKAYDVPSVLVEIGFITNKDDEAQMTSTGWRDRTAVAMVGAIDRYFADRVAGGR